MIKRSIVFGLATLMLGACATSTPYTPVGDNGYGFSEQRIEDNRYQVSFRGNSSTTRERVENSLLYRAAELTRMNGFDYFIVSERDMDESTTYSSTSSLPAFYGRYAFVSRRGRVVRHFPYYAYGYRWGHPARWHTSSYTRYSASAYITMFQGDKPADDIHAFDAHQVIDNLSAYITTSDRE